MYCVCQACRGTDLDVGIDVADHKDDMLQVRRIPIEADFLYMYSSAPGGNAEIVGLDIDG